MKKTKIIRFLNYRLPNNFPASVKVLLAMSGGVDSSVAALLLKKQGYEVVAAFMKNWSDAKNKITGECQWREERRMAQKICARLNIKLVTLDFEKEYKKDVVDEMFKLYRKGITPNPDIDCNNKIKFPLLWKHAKKLGCEFIATGHYARIKKVLVKEKDVSLRSEVDLTSKSRPADFSVEDNINMKNFDKQGSMINDKIKMINSSSQSNINNSKKIRANENERVNLEVGNKKKEFQLLRAKDESKDQSYFLYRLTQKDLSHTLFPVGELTKKEVREIAKKNKFPNYDKKSTVGICFIGKVNLKDFLQKKIKPKKGKILDPRGNIIGGHDGIYYYTIGQRIGPRFGIEINKGNFDDKKRLSKWYVAKKDSKTNTMVVAPENHQLLFRREIYFNDEHWINKKSKIHQKIFSRIRHAGELLPGAISFDKTNKKIKITLDKAITGVSEGQAIVLYTGKVCLGGGVISFK